MPDWRAIAQARRYPLTDAELDRIVPVLDALEAAFRPLANALPHETEPFLIPSEAAMSGDVKE
jgi:hypothetical protein